MSILIRTFRQRDDLEARGHIDHLYASPEAVGTGAASAIYHQLESNGRELGLSRLFVEASECAISLTGLPGGDGPIRVRRWAPESGGRGAADVDLWLWWLSDSFTSLGARGRLESGERAGVESERWPETQVRRIASLA